VQLSFRFKLFLMVAVSAAALLLIVMVSVLFRARQVGYLDDLEGRLVPKLELGPKLESQFEHLRRRMQDAVAAQDPNALAASLEDKDRLIAELAKAGHVLDPAEGAALRHAVSAYHAIAHDVSRRMIRGESGEAFTDDIEEMQRRQHRTSTLIQKVSRLDRRELSSGFSSVREATDRAHRYRIAIALASLGLVLLLSLWTLRGALQSLSQISRGLSRFATGNFAEPIVVTEKLELGTLAREANQMAASLKELGEQRDKSDWLKAGLAALSDELRGELEPEDALARAMRYLARRLDAPAAAIYWTEDAITLRRAAAYALDDPDSSKDLPESFRIGEGLLGEAARAKTITVVEDPPPGYLHVQSGLGKAAPRVLVFVPFTRLERIVAVLELAFFKPYSEDDRVLLESSREMLTIVFEASRSRSLTRKLLFETQELAEQLAAQEEELRNNNEELSVNQHELLQANTELEAQRKELSDQNMELEEARERVEQKVAELAKVSSYKSQFLANMSHELRTPLNSMLLLSHLLAENDGKNLTPKQVEHCLTINSSGKDLLGLINQVLDLAKIEAGKQDLTVEPVPLAELAQYAERVFRPLAGDKGVELVVELASDLPATLVTDKQRLERILINLLGNAVKFTDQGTVRLAISRAAPNARLERRDLDPRHSIAFAVSDTGIGIPRAAQNRIFAPFEQLEARTDRRYGGTGLGLSIARESVYLLGGELTLESEEGRGSTFTCYLPLDQRASLTKPATPSLGPAQSRVETLDDRDKLAPSEPRLLIIEDDPVFAEQLLEIIHSRRFKAVVARNGEQGITLARETRPRGIILDVKLPDIDGWTVMERLRHDPATRTIPVHFISGVDAPERALALGAVGYVTKPASRGELIGIVQSLMRAVNDAPGRVLVVEDNVLEGESLLAMLREASFDASHVMSARAALEALHAERFGCVVLDLGLPDMDGLGLLESLRSNGKLDMPPVLVHTGRSLTREETRRIEAYAEAIVLKDGSSSQRLLDEIRLFVQRVRDDLPRDAEPRRTPPIPDVNLAGTKILLADDDMRTVYALSALLRGKGADVLVAETGREALEALAANPDVSGVLMDVMMPEMDGYEAMRRLRSEKRFAKLPVLALTAKAMKGERERCMEAGASDYLSKPVEPEKLLTTLAQWLRSGASHDHERD
jgi:CheY-like chemotaxis protein/signal transduction histidine kinase